MERAYEIVFSAALCVLAAYMFVCLFRAVKGPSTADRIIAVNMIGTIVIMMIVILSMMMNAGFLIDIALIYALLSFLAVVLLARLFIANNRRKGREENKK